MSNENTTTSAGKAGTFLDYRTLVPDGMGDWYDLHLGWVQERTKAGTMNPRGAWARRWPLLACIALQQGEDWADDALSLTTDQLMRVGQDRWPDYVDHVVSFLRHVHGAPTPKEGIKTWLMMPASKVLFQR